MAHRSFSVPQVMNTMADHHQGPVSINVPPLSGSLAYEMQTAIPRLEKILADELSSQTLPLCIQLLKSWVATSNIDKQQHQHQLTSMGRKPVRTLTRSRVSRWLLSSLSRKKHIAPAKDISESHHTDHSTPTLDLSATTTVTSSDNDDNISNDSSDRSIASISIHGDNDSYNASKILLEHDYDHQSTNSKASSLVSTPILRSAGMVQTPPHHPAPPPATHQYQYTSIAPYVPNESPTSTPIFRPTAPFRSRYSVASTSSSPNSIQNQDIQSLSTTTTKDINLRNDNDETRTTALAMQSSSRTASTAAITVATTAAAAATKLPRAKTTISGFLNKLGMSVKKAMGNRRHRRAHPAGTLEDHDCLDSFSTPHTADTMESDETEDKDTYLLENDQQYHEWDKEEIWRPRIEPNSREPKGKSPQLRSSETFSTLSDHESKRTIPRKPVQYAAAAAASAASSTLKHSKTDMDILREQSVPFIKMGLGRGLGEEEEDEQDDSVSVEARFPSGIHELQQWHHRFHEQQQHPDKLEANLQRVTAAVYKIIENNHATGYFDYDERGFRGTPLGHMQDRLFSSEPLTSPEDIYDQMAYIVECGQLTSEHVILAYVYLERMIDRSDQSLCDISWRFMLLAAMIVAVKVWDDCAVYNSDFVQIFPELNIVLVNKIERHFLKAIKYEVGCTPARFVSTYFDLRDGYHL
ncbi:hypothetical protein K492DRAFT_227081 [Lichtheimia hyalospora FSU 10163]|nr:hypothetical protein K492DRAFT_227081 [Lichtheimia hyalospora FSU 10163]